MTSQEFFKIACEFVLFLCFVSVGFILQVSTGLYSVMTSNVFCLFYYFLSFHLPLIFILSVLLLSH
ncbi:hypothetical protein GLOIN_2v1579425 [Rhizophagus irregularis DAOM 181602=DAOM 197198]|uniref:Uncharacterized protein n=1 Tax=Rhizophagus irregularis (strain DAOM 181602 / DAOM 197198 / MUCL 43194) TaxID=747089 RepID=A0A2P4Q8Z7_RHIID|nr:hypothetical protein GLOIN_2v1579425 [Rhizophagus irregularis DAOM 181602=DAOM 197198]POG74097.1 hypothetical protein GLOIN_2v1579425 [Rhizophagus irregularis DAOM 181602=DAOM 197198]|eukprot:XP_025180963.1 hypothetical protein GLOIN_2v1579425 [Rhizophagus irregularis DAOM 181602=DAOM 197198]